MIACSSFKLLVLILGLPPIHNATDVKRLQIRVVHLAAQMGTENLDFFRTLAHHEAPHMEAVTCGMLVGVALLEEAVCESIFAFRSRSKAVRMHKPISFKRSSLAQVPTGTG